MSKNAQKIAVPMISILLGFLLGAIVMFILAMIQFGAMRAYFR